MAIKMIIATDKNFGIGKDNSIPWDCPEDMKYFREQTAGRTVVMGRKTFESLPFEHGLPDRENVVFTNYFKAGTFCNKTFYTNLGEFLNYPLQKSDIWVIGGASIYRQLLPFVEEIHHTIIDGVYDCDTYFNMEFLKDWTLVGGKDLSENAVVNIWRKSK